MGIDGGSTGEGLSSAWIGAEGSSTGAGRSTSLGRGTGLGREAVGRIGSGRDGGIGGVGSGRRGAEAADRARIPSPAAFHFASHFFSSTRHFF